MLMGRRNLVFTLPLHPPYPPPLQMKCYILTLAHRFCCGKRYNTFPSSLFSLINFFFAFWSSLFSLSSVFTFVLPVLSSLLLSCFLVCLYSGLLFSPLLSSLMYLPVRVCVSYILLLLSSVFLSLLFSLFSTPSFCSLIFIPPLPCPSLLFLSL